MSKYFVSRKEEDTGTMSDVFPVEIRCRHCHELNRVLLDTGNSTIYLPQSYGGGEVEEGRGTPTVEHISSSRLSPTREQVEALRAEGLSFREIGRRFHVSEGVIRRRLRPDTRPSYTKRAKQSPRSRPSLMPQLATLKKLAAKGLSYREIAEAVNRSPQTVYSFMRAQGIEKEDAIGGLPQGRGSWWSEAIRRRKAGELPSTIAASLGVSHSSVYAVLKQAGLTREINNPWAGMTVEERSAEMKRRRKVAAERKAAKN